MACVTSLHANTITIGGTINQSTQDGTGPAANNPSLNNILDGALFTVNLSFNEAVTSPGTYSLSGLSLVFGVAAANSIENTFNSASLTVTQFGAFDQVSVLACLATGSGCNQGNELDLNFMVASTSLNAQNVAAIGIPNLVPLDLLEDDGVTDLHGVVTNYSYTPVPEPGGTVFVGVGLIVAGLICVRWRPKNRRH
jgi:hypothetical protein